MDPRLLLIPFVLLIMLPVPVYADGLGIEERIIGFFEWVFDFGKANNNLNGGSSQDIDDRNKAIDSTKDFAVTGTKWFFDGKDSVIAWIVSESPIPLDTGIISIIAIAIMVVLLLYMLKEHWKHALIITIVIGSVITLLILFNINFHI